MKKFKKGETVLITSGKDKGKTGEIIRLLPKVDKVVVKGMNLYKRSRRPTQNAAGGIVVLERPLPTSKISHSVDGKPIRFNKRKKA